MKKHLLTGVCALLFPYVVIAQIVPRSVKAHRTTRTILIDGVLEDAWKEAPLITDYVEFRPVVGRKEEKGNHTESYLMYDDEGIYFGGICYERNADSISKELSGRDGFGMNDYIGLILDTYNDKLNGFEYFVTPLGEQWDAKMTTNYNSDNGGEDFSWNAVWKSAVKIHDKGWTFEIFLPYSAIRFSKGEVQNWGLNITRRRRKTEQQYTWSPIDPNVNGFLTQEGQWTEISNIKPPVRLQLSPYFSVYGNHFPAGKKSWTNQVSGGLDLKLGLSQAFTLDATLIPDFGQVQSDNQVLNLTPFEVKFNEYRTFFTEGTELFSKGNLFYSRRIGGTPVNLGKAYQGLKANETVEENPVASRLINASKISGRTKGGLGIGLLNAVTAQQEALIRNNETGETRTVETDPLTNYNIFVLDQTMKHNSSVSFINTSVLRGGDTHNANVSSALFSLFDKKNTYNLTGNVAVSHLNYKQAGSSDKTGYSHNFGLGKTSGKFVFNLSQELTDTRYTSNDLGYFTNNNYINHYLYLGYRYIEPKGWYNRLFYNFNANISSLYSGIGEIPSKYQSSRLQVNINAQTKKLNWGGVFFNYNPPQNDFYEPRVAERVFRRAGSVMAGFWIESNYAKKYSFATEFAERVFIDFYRANGMDIFLQQNYRFNSKFAITHSISYMPRPRSVGFTAVEGEDIFFAVRKVTTFDHILNLKYNFTNKMGLTFRARHYVSTVKNREYYSLNQSGSLSPSEAPQNPHHKNVNYFNIDMVYTWQFAPGSFLNVVWKNAVFNDVASLENSYFGNLRSTLQTDQNNNISVKVIYFMDYLELRRSLAGKK